MEGGGGGREVREGEGRGGQRGGGCGGRVRVVWAWACAWARRGATSRPLRGWSRGCERGEERAAKGGVERAEEEREEGEGRGGSGEGGRGGGDGGGGGGGGVRLRDPQPSSHGLHRGVAAGEGQAVERSAGHRVTERDTGEGTRKQSQAVEARMSNCNWADAAVDVCVGGSGGADSWRLRLFGLLPGVVHLRGQRGRPGRGQGVVRGGGESRGQQRSGLGRGKRE